MVENWFLCINYEENLKNILYFLHESHAKCEGLESPETECKYESMAMQQSSALLQRQTTQYYQSISS